MAVSTLRDEHALSVRGRRRDRRRGSSPRASLVNLLNPKLTLFFFAFLPQFVTRAHATARMLALSAVFMVVTFVVFALYGIGAAAVRDRLISRPRITVWMRRVLGGAFVALAGKLALTSR